MKKQILLLGIIFSIIFSLGFVGAVQEPEGWWNVSANMFLTQKHNITNEINYTSANLTLSDTVNLLINYSNLSFTLGGFLSDTGVSKFNLTNSLLVGNHGIANINYVYLRRSKIINILNSSISDFNQVVFEGLSTNVGFVNIINSKFHKIDKSIYFNGRYDNYIYNNSFYNITGVSGVEALIIKSNNKSVIRNNNFTLINNSGIILQTGTLNVIIENNTFNRIIEIPIVNSNSNNTLIRYNNMTNFGFDGTSNGYCIDIKDVNYNISIENNLCINGSMGISISMTDGGGGGLISSKNNKMCNISRIGYGLSFSNVEVGGFISENDYIENATVRGLSIRISDNGNITNLFMKNNVVLDVLLDGDKNTTFNNLTISNPAIQSFNIINSNSTNIINSLIDSDGDFYGYINNSFLINFSNVLGYYFYMDNATSLEFNLSLNRLYFKSIGSKINIIQNSQLTNALIYNTNNSIYGSTTISANDGNINITLPPNNATYVLDNFNLTEGVTREHSPIAFGSSTDTEKHITSSLTQGVYITVAFGVGSCDGIGTITYTSDTGAMSTSWDGRDYCEQVGSDFIVTFDNILVEPATSSNIFTIEDDAAVLDICSSMQNGFGKFAEWIPTFFTIFAIIIIIALISLVIVTINNPTWYQGFNFDFGGINLIYIFLSLGILAILFVVSMIVMWGVCSI